MKKRTYIAIDLKSFYASVECQERGLNPLETNLVVADTSRSEKTICLAVSPSLKSFGLKGRCRLFEVVQKVKEVNRERSRRIGWKPFIGSSLNLQELENPYLELSYLAAPPRMALYIEYSARIYNIYLQYLSKDDIHVYSIDEVFMDVTDYLKLYHMTAHEFARFLIQKVMDETGITATAGIGENLFLCKCAMDIVAKHIPADKDGVRIAELTEESYRKTLWTHRPLTDFWRVGNGIARKLEAEGMFTMGDIARCSVGGFTDYYNEDLLYKMFGVNAELLIDHAWGQESCTMKDIKSYKPSVNSMSVGQVLSCAYNYEDIQIIIKEMCDELSLKLVKEHKNTDGLVLQVGYDISSLNAYHGDVVVDFYGRVIPKSLHVSTHFSYRTSSSRLFQKEMIALFQKNTNPKYMYRRVNLVAMNVKDSSIQEDRIVKMNLFEEVQDDPVNEEDETKIAETLLKIKEKYGKNAVIKGLDLNKKATTKQRNEQIGGHKA